MITIRKTNNLFATPRIPVTMVADSKYEGKVVESKSEFELALGLRRDVFRRELCDVEGTGVFSDRDEYDAGSFHLLVTHKESGEAVGTYRLNGYNGSIEGFYGAKEFCLEDIPAGIISKSVELGRACIAREHRNSRVLFLLWSLLANYMTSVNCRYLFGCCSVFTQDAQVAANVLAKLRAEGHVDESLPVRPRPEKAIIQKGVVGVPEDSEIPPLVNIYMRIGARICGEPAIDRDMKTVDYFVLFDLEEINRKYRKMFFGA